jgi:sulfur-oxidizing protein SoxA
VKRWWALGVWVVAAAHAAWADIPLDARQSSTELLSPGNRAMQEDLSQNPASFWLMEGETLWQQPAGPRQASCQGCHGRAQDSMKGVAARYPRRIGERLLNLEDKINQCRQERQGQTPWKAESPPLLSMSVWVAHQSKGMPIENVDAPELQHDLRAGRQLFEQRVGQIRLSCAQCHDQRWGQRLAGVVIPQAHPTGYPIYRLEWQSLGSLERRLRNCMNAVRAEPYAAGAPEWRQLELYLKWRARGMAVETPALRP